jgi:ribosomal protein L22
MEEDKKPIIKPEEKPTTDIKKEDKKTEDKKPEKKIETKKPKKTQAIVNARNLPISTKHSIAICNMIRNKDIDNAILLLKKAEKKQIPVPMRGEIPHRKGIMSGRYPIKALGHFIKALKSLKANALANELELEKYKIFCKADIASRPYRRFGRGRFKRTNLTLKLIIPIKKKKNKSKKQKHKKI